MKGVAFYLGREVVEWGGEANDPTIRFLPTQSVGGGERGKIAKNIRVEGEKTSSSYFFPEGLGVEPRMIPPPNPISRPQRCGGFFTVSFNILLFTPTDSDVPLFLLTFYVYLAGRIVAASFFFLSRMAGLPLLAGPQPGARGDEETLGKAKLTD